MFNNKNFLYRSVFMVSVVGFWLTSITVQAAEHPDFSGSWTNYRAPGGLGSFGATDGELKLNAQAISARDDFLSVTEGTNYGAGNACVGYGMPSSVLGSGGYPMEIIQRPDQLFAIYEAHSEIRRVYIGTEAGDPSTFFPERNGYSSAYWRGDHLIVETTRLKTQVDSRHPHSNQAVIYEDYYLDEALEDGTRVLVNELTMIDPTWLEEPYVTVKRWQEMSDYHVLAYECSEPKWLDEMEVIYEEAGLEMIQD
jgi:hypothetical protein